MYIASANSMIPSKLKILIMKILFFGLIVMFFTSCAATKKSSNESFVIIEGKKIELFADEYGNGYMKQAVRGGYVYIPFVFPYEEDKTAKRQ
jgi:hypothetical protein